MGAITRQRTFIVAPRGADLKIPSDLLGLTLVQYSDDSSNSLEERLRGACDKLVAIVRSGGPK